MDFAAFETFCSANGLDANLNTSVKAYETSLRGPGGGPKRDYTTKTVTLIAKGEGPDGEILFREATGIPNRSREHAASRLRWQMETEDGATGVRIFPSEGEIIL